MRKLAWAALVLVVGGWLAMKTSFASYAGTLWSQAGDTAKEQIPTRFEIDRARHELKQLDGDIGAIIRPIAEYKADIARLHKEIARTQAALDEQKPVLLTMTKDLAGSPSFVSYGGTEYAADRVREKLHRDFEGYQRMERNLASQRKLLEAKEKSMQAAQDQLTKVIAKKKEFEVRLAQLEADEETLQISRLGSRLEFDNSRTTQIEAALAEIEQRHNVQRAEIELKTQTFVSDTIPVGGQRERRLNPDAIRAYLENGAPRETP
jgi:peptidoglycan hydrolase CwlO-like protein